MAAMKKPAKKKGKAQTKQPSKLKAQYRIVEASHAKYADGIKRGNERLYKLLGEVLTFGRNCVQKKNAAAFDAMLKTKGVELSGENYFLPIVKIVFGEWESKANKSGEVKTVWNFDRSTARYATVLRYLNWKDVKGSDVATYIKNIGRIAKVTEQEKKFREDLGLPSKARDTAKDKLTAARKKISGRSALKSLVTPANLKDSGGFVLLIGKADASGNVTIKAFADAGEGTINNLVVKTSAAAKSTKSAGKGSPSQASNVISMYEIQKKLAANAA